MMNAVMGLAGIRLPTLASHDRRSLTECEVLQASLGGIGYLKGLVLAGRKGIRGKDAINCILKG